VKVRLNSILVCICVMLLVWGSGAMANAVPNQAMPTCQDLSRFVGMHKQTVFDPDTDTIKIIAYGEEGQVMEASFRLMATRPETCANEATATLIAGLQQQERSIQASRCQGLRQVVNGELPVPERNGRKMDISAAKIYFRERCESIGGRPK
jgi:hypothetical protein